MTTPAGKKPPFKLHFILGMNGENDVKAHHKREFGWLPNRMRSGKMARKKQQRKRR